MAEQSFWDQRFDRPGYYFGTAPNAFLAAQTEYLTPGARALAVADGEGRNAVFMAEHGCRVVSMDNSAVGIEKARRLAAERGVEIDARFGDIFEWDWAAEPFDVIAAIFFQFVPPEERPRVFEGLKTALAPGGVLLLHGYTPKQIEYGTGGPPWPDHLYTEELLREAFGDLEILRLEAYEAEVDEGTGHSGRSALIDLVARKPG